MLAQYYPQPHPHNAMFELNKDVHFAAAHMIPSALAGKCSKVHGHTYWCNITVIGNALNEAGFLVDFRDLKHMIEDDHDHKYLNLLPEYTVNPDDHPSRYPSTEVVASNIWMKVRGYLQTQTRELFCPQVILRETPESYVLFRPVMPEEWRIA